MLENGKIIIIQLLLIKMEKINLKIYQIVLMISITLILLVIDFLIFHDYFKPGETYTLVEYLIGLASILIIVVFGSLLIRNRIE